MADGGVAPLLAADASALCALLLAAECCTANELDDEAPLLQLLHRCSAALSADVAAAALSNRPAVAVGATAADAAGTKTAAAESASAPRKHAAGKQGSATAAQHIASGTSRTQHADGWQPSRQQQSAAEKTAVEISGQQSEYDNPQWALVVTRALEVCKLARGHASS